MEFGVGGQLDFDALKKKKLSFRVIEEMKSIISRDRNYDFLSFAFDFMSFLEGGFCIDSFPC